MSEGGGGIDLELVETDDLVEEILKRNEHTVIVFMRSSNGAPGDKPRVEIEHNWRGDLVTCLGLLSKTQIAIVEDLESTNEVEDSG